MFIDSPDLFACDPLLLGVVDVACLAAKEALLAAAAVAVAAAAAADVVVVEAVGPDEAGVGARARRRGRSISDWMSLDNSSQARTSSNDHMQDVTQLSMS